jgi:purine-binding chemotaxis protein CheW
MKSAGLEVVFRLDDVRLALSLSAVDRVVRAVEITPLPKAPAIVLGIINVQGQVLPVFNLRRRFRLPERELELSDHFIIARTARRLVALAVDEVRGVTECAAEEIVAPEAIVPGIEYVEAVVKRPDGLMFIHNLDTFLALDEEQQLEDAPAS